MEGVNGAQRCGSWTPAQTHQELPVHKWVDLFILHLTQTVGVCKSPLNYVVRVIAAINATPPVCHVDDPHSKETGPIDGNLALTAPMLHNHPLYKVDNGLVFDLIENTIHGNNVAISIALFCRVRDGHEALIALKSQ